MKLVESAERRAVAVDQFEKHEGRQDGGQVTNGLAYGMNTLRDLLYERIHNDVEREFGMDSMLVPVSEEKSERNVKVEIEIFQIAVAAMMAGHMEYVKDRQWFIGWLGHLRLGEALELPGVEHRLQEYLAMTPEQQRLKFVDVLLKVMPESNKAPLVLQRLFPWAVGVVTATAFGDHFAASELRNRQIGILPAISDCAGCHGRPLENGDRCDECGNPVWKYKWLNAID